MCMCHKVYSNGAFARKVSRRMTEMTLKEEIITLLELAMNCPQFFYITFYKLLEAKMCTLLTLELTVCNKQKEDKSSRTLMLFDLSGQIASFIGVKLCFPNLRAFFLQCLLQ
jgi:hypothetical protein